MKHWDIFSIYNTNIKPHTTSHPDQNSGTSGHRKISAAVLPEVAPGRNV
jgi:hypothetical protein